MNRRLPSGVFVTTDSPEYLERQIEPTARLVDLAKQNCADIRAAWIEKQRVFDTTPFDPDGQHLRIFPGDVTIWSGYPGAGKSTLLRQLVCHLLYRQQGVFIASLEEDPADVFVSLACTAAGRTEPSEAELEWFVFAYADRLRLWGEIGIARHQELLALIRVLAKQGIRHAVIDSFMCLDIDSGDWEAQRQFANGVCTTANVSGCHIHLVAHPRKPMTGTQDDSDIDVGDVAGSADLGRRVDNVLFVRRAPKSELPLSVPQDQAPMRISIRKQRHGSGRTGNIEGWFHRNFRQYHTEQFITRATRYLPDAAYETAYGPGTVDAR